MTTATAAARGTVTEPGRIVWRCSKCHQPIAPGAGYVAVNGATAQAHAEAWSDYQDAHRGQLVRTVGDMPDLPLAKWRPWHASCDPDPDAGSYWIDVHRAGTLAELIHWTGHLMDKAWIRDTDWPDLLMQLGTDS